MSTKAVMRLAALASALAAIGAGAALAQDVAPDAKPAVKAEAEKKKKDNSATLKAYDAGARAFEQGKLDQAVKSLSAALSAGGLPSQQMAKALYYRGTAYRKQGKPAQAISDLTTAVWLKNGLSDADRALAIDQRQGAYREAGLGDTAPPVVAQKAEPAQAAQTAQPVQQGPAPGAVVSQVQSGNAIEEAGSSITSFFGNLFGGNDGAGAKATASSSSSVMTSATGSGSWAAEAQGAAEASAGAGEVQSGQAEPQAQEQIGQPAEQTVQQQAALQQANPVAAGEAPALNAVQNEGAAAAPEGPNALEQAGSSIVGFFSNMFSGSGDAGAQATQTSSSPVLTSSTGGAAGMAQGAVGQGAAGQSAAGQKSVAAGGGAPVELDWGQATEVQSARGKTVAVPAGAGDRPAAASGKYRLQVAAVRSREEALRVAERLASEGPALVGAGQETLIDETVIGSMGTFYRVRIGPYADAGAPGKLCAALRPKGYDCLVVTQ
jgi:tetratricopeptide (TPR) repeat protein